MNNDKLICKMYSIDDDICIANYIAVINEEEEDDACINTLSEIRLLRQSAQKRIDNLFLEAGK